MKPRTTLFMVGSFTFHRFEIAEVYATISTPARQSWAAMNKGKKSKRQRRK